MPRRRTAICTPPSTTSRTSSIVKSRSTRKSSPITARGTWRSASADPRHRAERRAARMRLVIISGLSGSGKSVALHLLEDLGFYCIDNIPVGLLHSFVDDILLANDG